MGLHGQMVVFSKVADTQSASVRVLYLGCGGVACLPAGLACLQAYVKKDGQTRRQIDVLYTMACIRTCTLTHMHTRERERESERERERASERARGRERERERVREGEREERERERAFKKECVFFELPESPAVGALRHSCAS